MKLRLGTRRSLLAQTQSAWVARQLLSRIPDLEIETILITTSGDRGIMTDDTSSLKAMFTKELEEALLDQRIDFAVHSMKDMPAEVPAGLMIGAVPEREDPRDVLISTRGMLLANLPTAARIGTSAVRRVAQLSHIRPDLVFLPIRGNVDTRLKRLQEGSLDAMVLAMAGLKRLGKTDAITEVFSTDYFLPAIGQGALAIEIREHDPNTATLVGLLNNHETATCVDAERSFMHAMNGSCQTPIAGYARIENGKLILNGAVLDRAGKRQLRREVRGETWEAQAVGSQLAGLLYAAGANELLCA